MKSSADSLETRLAHALELVPKGARYAHYKHPERTYRVVTISLIEETLEPAVVYEAEYGERLSFIRPLSNFLEIVTFEGEPVPRFSPINEQVPGTE